MADDTPTLEFKGVPAPQIHLVRGEPVLQDTDVAVLFDVETRRLNEQVKRNADKFGNDFAFQLTEDEFEAFKSQNTPANSKGHGGRRKPPWMFTEHGVVMAATVLKSDRANMATRFIVNIFVQARRNQQAHGKANSLSVQPKPSAGLALGDDMRHGLIAKLDTALGRVLDAIAGSETTTSVRDEAQAVFSESVNAIKQHLKKQEIGNKKTLAEIHKLLKEAESLETAITGKRIENQHRQLAYLAKQLRMVIEIQRYLDTGGVEGLLLVLQDLGGEN